MFDSTILIHREGGGEPRHCTVRHITVGKVELCEGRIRFQRIRQDMDGFAFVPAIHSQLGEGCVVGECAGGHGIGLVVPYAEIELLF